ncbi:MAG: hypothetical protein J0L55_14690 [Caulobacterales bacterium]|nr:hypothetical protein [Caulobacterales bacterium]
MTDDLTNFNDNSQNEKPTQKALGLRRIRIKFLRSLFVFGIAISFIGFILAFAYGIITNQINAQKQLVKGDNLILEKPTFIGHSIKGGQITVTAEDATRPIGDDSGIIVLKKPILKTQTGININADSGKWNQAAQELTLNDNVKMNYSNGDIAVSQSAFYGQKNRTSLNGETISDAIIALQGGVIITRKTGEVLESNAALWNDALGILKLGEAAQIPNNINNPEILDFAKITLANGNATAKSLEINANNEILYGSGGVNLNFGKISASADRYEFHSKTKRIILRGNAHANFYK